MRFVGGVAALALLALVGGCATAPAPQAADQPGDYSDHGALTAPPHIAGRPDSGGIIAGTGGGPTGGGGRH
jgi:hypothetical protein